MGQDMEAQAHIQAIRTLHLVMVHSKEASLPIAVSLIIHIVQLQTLDMVETTHMVAQIHIMDIEGQLIIHMGRLQAHIILTEAQQDQDMDLRQAEVILHQVIDINQIHTHQHLVAILGLEARQQDTILMMTHHLTPIVVLTVVPPLFMEDKALIIHTHQQDPHMATHTVVIVHIATVDMDSHMVKATLMETHIKDTQLDLLMEIHLMVLLMEIMVIVHQLPHMDQRIHL